MKIFTALSRIQLLLGRLWRSVEAFHNIEDNTGNEGEYLERLIPTPTLMPIHCGTQCTCEVNSPSTKPMW
jgi:hypothetical protein